MPSMTIYVAGRGTPLAEGGTSAVGHMFYTLTDTNGTTYSYGFAPANHGEPFGPGRVYTNDVSNYLTNSYKNEVSISETQFQDVLAWSELSKLNGSYGDYSGIGNNCITFTYDAMAAAGLHNTYVPFYHDWWPTWNSNDIDLLIKQYQRKSEFGNQSIGTMQAEGWNIDDLTNTLYLNAQNWQPPRDPLVLDLDGDGIETIGITGNTPVLFDHDADGIRTGTGWIGADDGLLVLDLNGNGVIDTGRELFGDNTRLPSVNGTTANAANGYQALAQHDSNADGQINSQDTIYSQLRVWRDLNQDGISQEGEMQTLAQLGIASIGVHGNFETTNLGQGNSQIASGTYTRTDGTSGASGVAELTGSLLLASNNFYSEFTDNPTISTPAQGLPQMGGSGWVRDLRAGATRVRKTYCRRVTQEKQARKLLPRCLATRISLKSDLRFL